MTEPKKTRRQTPSPSLLALRDAIELHRNELQTQIDAMNAQTGQRHAENLARIDALTKEFHEHVLEDRGQFLLLRADIGVNTGLCRSISENIGTLMAGNVVRATGRAARATLTGFDHTMLRVGKYSTGIGLLCILASMVWYAVTGRAPPWPPWPL